MDLDDASTSNRDSSRSRDDSAEPSILATINTRKRPRPEERQRQQARSVKRIKLAYSDEYRRELNSAIEQLNDHEKSSRHQSYFFSSQIGLTIWTGEEKARLFAALARHGSYNLSPVVREVHSKPETAVLEYLELLQQGVADSGRHDKRVDRLIRAADIAPAAEISAQCCEALELSADALSLLEQHQHARVQEKLFGEEWRLTIANVAGDDDRSERLNDRTYSESATDTAKDRLTKATKLLDCSRLLQLSREVFMKGPELDANWQAHGEASQIGISGEALTDLHGLVIGVTRRMMSTSLFHAMSRHRCREEEGSFDPETATVSQEDVWLACQSLELAQDSQEFWRSCPRRLRLTPVDFGHKTHRHAARRGSLLDSGRGKAVTLEEAERLLSPNNGLHDDAATDTPAVISVETGEESLALTDAEAAPLGSEESHTDSSDHDVRDSNDVVRYHDSDAQLDHEDSDDVLLYDDSDDQADQEGSDGVWNDDADIQADQEDSGSRNARKPVSNSTSSFVSQREMEDTAAEDAYLEFEDQRHSAEEERRLWALLGASHPLMAAPDAVRASSIEDRSRTPPKERREPRELVSWRQCAMEQYRASWERYPEPIPPDAFHGYTPTLIRADWKDRSRVSRSTSRTSSSVHERGRSQSRGRERRPRSVTPAGSEISSSREKPKTRGFAADVGTRATTRRTRSQSRRARSRTPAYTFTSIDEEGYAIDVPQDDYSEDEYMPD